MTKQILQLNLFEGKPLGRGESSEVLVYTTQTRDERDIPNFPGHFLVINHDPKEGSESSVFFLTRDRFEESDGGNIKLQDGQSDKLQENHGPFGVGGYYRIEASRTENPGRGGVERG